MGDWIRKTKFTRILSHHLLSQRLPSASASNAADWLSLCSWNTATASAGSPYFPFMS